VDHGSRRQRLTSRLADVGADAFLITFLPNVRYLTGYTGSNGQVLVSEQGSVFFTDGRYEEQSRHEVPDLDRVIYSDAFREALVEACGKLQAKSVAFEEASVSYKTFRELSAKLDLVPAADEVGRLRWVKDDEELAKIQKAQDITDAALDAVLPTLAEGRTELEVARGLQRSMEDNGAEGLAFETIAAFGENAAEPHHSPTERPLRRGDVVKLDFGARWDGYHSDMTRTVAFGDPGERIREIYEVVRASQQAGIGAVRAGVEGSAADAASRKVIDDAGFGDLFGHGLGHGVGLEIHEGPTLRRVSRDVLPVGSVVTVEPGIYVPGLGGVRIEDMVEVLEGGCRPMPSSAKELVIL
jgi:Xaa-Pro aminopeptidase